MGNWGIKVSQDGFDVKTCDDKDLVMSSKFELLRTKATGTVLVTTDIPHGLSYIPIFFTNKPFITAGHYSLIGECEDYCDVTNLHVFAEHRYYIFYNLAI
jgi:hypothetical protein